ncbi:MAG: hypothetical protein MUC34_21190 [Anaerolineae bacterium]|nr:hypothetical protein [Anaerolineae bacterium]
MAVNDVVDLLRMLRRGAGEELERAAGPEAITLVEEIDGLVRERMRQSDMYFSLWDEFDTDPDSNRAELIGAIEAAVEGDAEFGARLKSLEEEYDRLALDEGAGHMEEPDAGVLVTGHLEDGAALIGEDGAALTAGQFEPEQGGRLLSSRGDMDGETMLGQGADAAPITDGEDILGSAYVYEQFLPDEDLEDSAKRPGSLYDSPAETEAATRPLSTGDIRTLIQPVEMALEGNLDIRERDRALLRQRLGWIEEELRRGQALDGERLRGDMIYVRDAAPDLWDILVWNLRDVGELLPVAAQSALSELAGPAQRRATADG